MSDLETQIRTLKLRSPGDGLDIRVDAILKSEPAIFRSNEVIAASASESDTVWPLHASRRGFVLTSSWWIAAAAMVAGIFIGSKMPPSRSQLADNASSGIVTPATQDDGSVEILDGAHRENLSVGSSNLAGMAVPGPSNRPDPSVGSQIVESSWLSPTAATVVWEQQTGQIFTVVNHVNDGRFNMCRECHRVMR